MPGSGHDAEAQREVRRPGARTAPRAVPVLLAVGLALAAPGLLGLRVYHSEAEALALAFPAATRFEEKVRLVDEAQREAASRVAGVPVREHLVTFHEAWRGEELLGRGVVLKAIGKSLPFRFLVSIRPDGRVDQVLVLTYREPRGQEIERGSFRAQYRGKTLADPIRRGEDIRNITGATISVDSLSRGVRRALALHRVLVEEPAVHAARGGAEAPERSESGG